MKLDGVIVDLDSWARNSRALLLLTNNLEDLQEVPAGLETMIARLTALARRGIQVYWESSNPSHIVGSALFITKAPSDGYISHGFGETTEVRLGRLKERLDLAQSDEWLYLSNNPENLATATRFGFQAEATKTFLLQEGLSIEAKADRKPVSESLFTEHLNNYVPGGGPKIVHPLLPSQIYMVGSDADHFRWVKAVAPILRNIFPAQAILGLDTTFAFTNYYQNPYKAQPLWDEIKDWHGRHSGRNPNLLNLNFVAAVMASAISTQDFDYLVPVPSTHTAESPTMASVRLARLIGMITGVPKRELLLKNGKHSFERTTLQHKPLKRLSRFCLIDDQITTGRSVYQSREILQQDFGAASVTTYSFSTTRPFVLSQE